MKLPFVAVQDLCYSELSWSRRVSRHWCSPRHMSDHLPLRDIVLHRGVGLYARRDLCCGLLQALSGKNWQKPPMPYGPVLEP